jgi:hypothetical protein
VLARRGSRHGQQNLEELQRLETHLLRLFDLRLRAKALPNTCDCICDEGSGVLGEREECREDHYAELAALLRRIPHALD